MTAIRSPAVWIAYRSFSISEGSEHLIFITTAEIDTIPMAAKLLTITTGA